jgi:hypothetical protein
LHDFLLKELFSIPSLEMNLLDIAFFSLLLFRAATSQDNNLVWLGLHRNEHDWLFLILIVFVVFIALSSSFLLSQFFPTLRLPALALYNRLELSNHYYLDYQGDDLLEKMKH